MWLQELESGKHAQGVQTHQTMKQIMKQFKWWYRGLATDGTRVKFEGRIEAPDITEALTTVERYARLNYPGVRWMRGRRVETGNVRYGPTVQLMKSKPNKA